jgi:hypothetical protein
VLTQCVARIGSTLGQIFVKPKLLAKLCPALYFPGLLALALENTIGSFENFLCFSAWNEKRTVGITKNDIFSGYYCVAKTSGDKCVRIAWVNVLRTGRTSAVSKNGKTNADKLVSVTMAAPDNYPG